MNCVQSPAAFEQNNVSLQTPQPHFIPGYTGYVPQEKFRPGHTYGVTSHRILLDPCISMSPRSVLNNVHPEHCSVWIPRKQISYFCLKSQTLPDILEMNVVGIFRTNSVAPVLVLIPFFRPKWPWSIPESTVWVASSTSLTWPLAIQDLCHDTKPSLVTLTLQRATELWPDLSRTSGGIGSSRRNLRLWMDGGSVTSASRGKRMKWSALRIKIFKSLDGLRQQALLPDAAAQVDHSKSSKMHFLHKYHTLQPTFIQCPFWLLNHKFWIQINMSQAESGVKRCSKTVFTFF